jgi:hypothetical protein
MLVSLRKLRLGHWRLGSPQAATKYGLRAVGLDNVAKTAFLGVEADRDVLVSLAAGRLVEGTAHFFIEKEPRCRGLRSQRRIVNLR